jgi:pyrroloquinoline quinone biosynthesis protein D
MKLRHDPARDRWIIQGPERVFSPDAIAVEVLRLCDGARTVAGIADDLASRYDAPKEQILADIVAMLQDLADKGVVSCTDAHLH